ncbi:heavy-metal-associated domain-containing protein [Nocardia flavorosea]|uniref:Heavy-metal-associated domain-containing protein n=1 Tax=Nocardia flavorosea TaxID=53429 RepID=A0A846YB38_9NOCA|nr:heavy-metal-associated domain-containing protein [Nocardia flavorosea]NKY55010.1 heavy-metal-associated domain-containing protein [Nocardia flavorosea]
MSIETGTSTGSTETTTRYHRRTAAQILSGLARPGLFGPSAQRPTRSFEYTATELQPEPGSHLTFSQRLYLERFMRPCTAGEVTSATHRMTWTDSAGIPNTGFYRDDGFGPQIPIAAREAVLVLWEQLAAEDALAERIDALGAAERDVLAATTTDHDPIDIFRVGVESAGRALAQHALIAARAPYPSAAEFAHGLLDSGIFTAVATRWFWELQASTYRRGMIPVDLRVTADGTVRYPEQTVATLRAMKDATIADAHRVMRRATTEEGLSVADAIARYHDDLDLISRQYALLPAEEHPVCLAAVTHRAGGENYSLLPLVTRHFVAVFGELVVRCEPVAAQAAADAPENLPVAAEDRIFYVPDMTCKHCVRTIGGVLESMDIRVVDIDLDSKRVIAEFRSPRNRSRAFEALRDGGYNPVDRRTDTAPAVPGR